MYKKHYAIDPIMTGYIAMGATGVAYALLGGLTLLFNFEPLLRFGVGGYHLALSVIFLTAFLAGFKAHSRSILTVAFAVYVLDLLMMVRSIYFINHKTYIVTYVVWAYVASQWLKGVRNSEY